METPTNPALPPLPRYDFKRIGETFLTLQAVTSPFTGDRLVNPTFSNLVHEIALALKRQGVLRDVIFASCTPLLGTPFMTTARVRLCWRLAGNIDALRRGNPVALTPGFSADQWVPLRVRWVTLAQRVTRQFVQHGRSLQCQVLGGPLCGDDLTCWWSDERCRYVARFLGFTRGFESKLRYYTPLHLTGLRLYGLVAPPRPYDEGLRFETVTCTPSMRQFNVRILHRRFRVTPCPRQYEHPCHVCAVGYLNLDGQEGCYAACHPTGYQLGECDRCGRPDVVFDPQVSTETCAECLLLGYRPPVADEG